MIVFDAGSLERRAAVAAHAGSVTALAISADGKALLSGGADGRVRRHTPESLAPHDDVALHAGGVRALVLLADGRCVSAGNDGVATVSDTRTGATVTTPAAGRGPVVALAVAPSVADAPGSPGVVALAFQDGESAGFSLETGERLVTLAGDDEKVARLAASPDGRYVATGTPQTGAVSIVDARGGKVVAACAGHKGTITELGFSADGRHLLSAAQDNHVNFWKVPGGEPVSGLGGLEESVLAVAESPRHDRLATGSADGTVRLWDASHGDPLVILRGHTKRVRAVTFSPDGTWLVSVSDDGTARVWGRAEADIFAARMGW